jgi:hypothetical protein
LKAVTFGLEQGFNPFEHAKEAIVEFQQQAVQQAIQQQAPVKKTTKRATLKTAA